MFEPQSARTQGSTPVIGKMRRSLASCTEAVFPSMEMEVNVPSNFFVVILTTRTDEPEGKSVNRLDISTAFRPPGWRKVNATRRLEC